MYTDPTGEISKLAIALLIVVGSLAVAAMAYTGYCIYEDIRDFDCSNQSEQDVMDAHFVSAYNETLVIKLPIGDNAFSFGIMFIGNGVKDDMTIQHEYGHSVHFSQIGLANYVEHVAIPSLKGFWFNDYAANASNYYSQPQEYIADMLGGVKRTDFNYDPHIVQNIAHYYWQTFN